MSTGKVSNYQSYLDSLKLHFNFTFRIESWKEMKMMKLVEVLASKFTKIGKTWSNEDARNIKMTSQQIGRGT